MITPELIGAHQSARQTYRRRLEREKQEKEKESKRINRQKEEERVKRKFDEEKQSWETKVSNVQNEIKVLKKTLGIQESKQEDALEKAESSKDMNQKESHLKVAKQALANCKELRHSLEAQQEILSQLMSKKPRNS